MEYTLAAIPTPHCYKVSHINLLHYDDYNFTMEGLMSNEHLDRAECKATEQIKCKLLSQIDLYFTIRLW